MIRAFSRSTGAVAGGSFDGPLLELKLCHVTYGLVPALRGVSLKVQPGEMVALLGANGAGKTTTLRAISGLVGVRSGQVLFKGQPIQGLTPPQVVRRRIAQMPEGRELFPQLTVKENLRYGYWPNRQDRPGFTRELNHIYEVFPRLSERAGQKAGTLSGGEQQMLTAGMALMSRPELLLVDELSLGLAPIVVRQLFDVLKKVNEAGTAILLDEQFVPLALANTERAYVLAKGEVVLEGRSAELKDSQELVASYMGGAKSADEAAGSPTEPAAVTKER